MGRHRHLVNVRADGIAVVLGPLLSDARITAAALVDVDSGMVLDAWSAAGPGAATAAGPPDLELLGAQHAEIVRCALALLRSWPDAGVPGPDGPEADTCEVVLGADGGPQHLLRTVPDPHGDRLALAVVVDGPPRVLDRVRKRLRSVSVDALTAGPSMTRRPALGRWSFAMPGPDVPARPERPARRGDDRLPAGPPGDRRLEPSGAPAPPGPEPTAAPPGPATFGAAPTPVGPSAPHPAAVPVPALSLLDAGRLELPGPRGPRPAPGPHLRPVRLDPAVAPPPDARRPAPAVHRPPSPPAALPAPTPPPRQEG